MTKLTFRTMIGRGLRMVACLALVLTATAVTAQAGACPPKPSVPEIDPGSILSAMTLLSGGVMILTDRRRRVAK